NSSGGSGSIGGSIAGRYGCPGSMGNISIGFTGGMYFFVSKVLSELDFDDSIFVANFLVIFGLLCFSSLNSFVEQENSRKKK
ncbi:MAG: hypothetical protein ACKO6A_01120, partial [Bacteroidota bacterium]